MICALIAAAELNDRFREEILDEMARGTITRNHAYAQYARDNMISKIASFSYRLGGILATDIDNYEIFSGIQAVFNKTRVKMDEGVI